MTRKDYILISDALKAARPAPTRVRALYGWALGAIAVCDALARDNPRFDRERFLKACGVQS